MTIIYMCSQYVYYVLLLFSSVKLSTLKKFDKEAYSQVTEKSAELSDTLYFNKGL